MRQRFGPWSFDTDARRLERDGVEVHLTPKAFELLAFLIEEAPRVVPKSEIHQRLWPATFVSDVTLSGLVKEIRRAFGKVSPPLIRTFHRVGFAFAGTLEAPAAARQPNPLHWLVRERERLPLVEGSNVIGRDSSSAIWLDVPGVSRRHACIVIEGTTATLADLGSKNGTLCEGAPVTKAVELRNADRIQLATVELVFRSSAASSIVTTKTQVGRARGGSPDVTEL